MIRFFGGRVMTLANGIETQDIEVWTEGSKIVFVGKPKAEELDGKVFEREYDLKGNLLMPSFKNAHTHSAMTFLRSYADDMPLQGQDKVRKVLFQALQESFSHYNSILRRLS